MKQLLTICMVLFATIGFAQNAIDTYFADFNTDDSCTSISISGKMFQLLTHIEGETPEEKEILEAITKLEGMKMLVKNKSAASKVNYAQAIKRLGPEFEELMRVDNSEEKLIFFIRETKGKIHELVLIGSDESEFFIMSLIGDIDLNQIAKIGRAIEVDGFEHLEKVGDKK